MHKYGYRFLKTKKLGHLITLNWLKGWLMVLYRSKTFPPNCGQAETFARVIRNVEILCLRKPRDILAPRNEFYGKPKKRCLKPTKSAVPGKPGRIESLCIKSAAVERCS